MALLLDKSTGVGGAPRPFVSFFEPGTYGVACFHALITGQHELPFDLNAWLNRTLSEKDIIIWRGCQPDSIQLVKLPCLLYLLGTQSSSHLSPLVSDVGF